MRKITAILLLTFSWMVSWSTHNRAGEILYCVDSNNPLKYHFTVITYTDPGSSDADRCDVELFYGDGQSDTIQRVNDGPGTNCICSHGNCGELVGQGIKMNIYEGTHTYSGGGTFIVSMNDPNRNSGILNIPNSVDVSFCLQDTLIIDPWAGANCTPELLFPPVDKGCVNIPYEHNPGAFDPDGDSLVYSFTNCYDAPGHQISGFQMPNQIQFQGQNQGTITIDQVSGTVIWDKPKLQGEYNLCILIEEYRDGVKVGSIIRDMQITIGPCNNEPPVIILETPLCVTAGDTIQETVKATDAGNDFISLTSIGEPYLLQNSPAFFNDVEGNIEVESDFYWETNCSHVKKDSYLVHFRAEDDGSDVDLVDYETMEITVVAPEPQNPSATAMGNNITVSWDPSICTNASCYKVYRKLDSLGWSPSDCETGVPAYTGYELVETLSGLNTTSFTDDGGGSGLQHGFQYCYMIVACFDDGAESYATYEVCAELKKDVPVITHVTVNTTSATTGSDSIIWSYPTELDLVQFPGPYHYKIYRDGFLAGSTNTDIVLLNVDTVFVDSSIDTETLQHQYRVELYYSGGLVGSTQTATSVFLSADPTDNQLTLTWTESVPWANTEYVIYRYNNQLSAYDTLDTVSVQLYVDSGLVNGKEYCYYVKSIGTYSAEGFINPILNRSQTHCSIPIDNVAPCPPQNPNITANCDDYQNGLTWTNPNNICADDVVGYNIYFAPFLGQQLLLADSIRDANTISYQQQFSGSIAGCYAITAIDTFYNESEFSEILCVDNCPVYELPLVFTPGSDGHNDFFKPFPYRFIESIDIKIYNRWGNLVFEETNPEILWDGTNEFTQKPCISGVYYYICEVYEIRLSGIESRTLKGYVQLIREGTSPKAN